MLVSLLKKFGLKFSLNDPRWGRGSQDDKQSQNGNQDGRRPPDGPPDLEQLWRDFNVRLNRLLGGKKGGGGSDSGGNGGGGFNPDMRGAGVGAAVVAVIAAFLWLISGFFIVQEGQTAVVMTFGKVSHMTPAGFNWRWPAPIQSHEIVNVSSVRTVEVGYRGNAKNKQLQESLMLTEDENIIDIQFAVQYRLKNAADWLFNNRDQEEMIKMVAESSIREVVGHSKMDFVLYEGREKVALDVGQLMQQILDRYKSGVQVANVTMQGVQPPEQVQAAFDDAVKAGQDRERAKNEGQAYANDVIPKARGAVSRLLQEAEGYKSRVVSTSEGDASRFKQVLVEYEKAPAVTRDRIYLETMQQIFTNTSKVMVDAKSGSNLLYLPLDKLISQSVASDPAAKAVTPAMTPAAAAPAESVELQRQRESRGRDREVR
ncbi:FtsH protease activity modulator HflK [Actimicrobium sp. CCC2.4]|uniref:FtsH protease activity modulator HflK n=1 Tax=Actimicrobium sp. CCC2.4 TaxID=3048606 RepID=UPI002AC947D2|nr:FtsH protease activity modulator HflK [Actimicrobium sp. CCC2.4]MEB0134054.1 FtsH protease activity modulator HflK [Actimicrobium sp. CCC2.4]WPX31587.1 FtsH protease activity modulator HflK [Actimicrobium sp. CCC2.4]